MKWLTIQVQGIREEVRKINWPKGNEMVKSTFTVLGFVVFFAAFFVVVEMIVSQVLRLLKVF